MYKSCNLILHGICFYENAIVSCCFAPNDQINGCLPPVLVENYKGEIIPKEKLFESMRKYSDQFKNGGCPVECKGCFQIQEKDWDESEYIDYVIITHYSVCNADCIYCSNNLEVEERTNDKYKVVPFLKYLKNEGVLKQNCELHIGGGEFTIYEESEEILSEFGLTGFAQIVVPTNAVKYSEKLHKTLQQGNACVVISLDSGSRETFKRIKRIDAFDKVVQNIYKYSEGTNSEKLTLKYIIVPGINDNISEFKKFLQIAKNAHARYIRIDIEARYLRSVNNNINPFYLKMAEKMNSFAEKEGFDTDLYAFLQQSLSNMSPKDKIKSLIEYIQLKYFKTGIKKFYTHHKY